MRKHTEDLPCKVPFCKECLANIKGLANIAKDMMTNPKQAPIETDYAKQPDGFVYRYWRVVGSNTWNIQKTAMKDVPYIETDLSSIQLGRWEGNNGQ